VKIKELTDYLSLGEKIVWGAVKSLQDDGSAFMPDESSVSPVEKF